MFWSKWFSYFVIGLLLICLWFFVIPYFLTLKIIDANLAFNLISEIMGLFFTLGIFIVLLEYREWLVWRKISKKVINRIGRQLQSIFNIIADLCKVIDVHFDHGAFDSKKYREGQLKGLVTKEIKLKDSWKEKEVSLFFADRIERAWEAIGIIDTRHGKFLNPDLQCSLLDIEDSLHKISFDLHFTDANMGDREKFLKIELKKLSKELGKLRERKLVDIGF